MMHKDITINTPVRIIDIYWEDAYWDNRKELIGKCGRFKNIVTKEKNSDYIGGNFVFDEVVRGYVDTIHCVYFNLVKCERINNMKDNFQSIKIIQKLDAIRENMEENKNSFDEKFIDGAKFALIWAKIEIMSMAMDKDRFNE